MNRYLFTTLPTNDLGLLTRSLPIAEELADRGNEVIFSNPAQAPRKIIKEAGFDNLIPRHPLYELAFSDDLSKRFRSIDFSSDYNGIFSFLFNAIRTFPYRTVAATTEVWDADHASAITGLLNVPFITSQVNAYINVIEKARCTAVVDFWNPFACIACRAMGLPLITVNQADALPGSRGFIWWKERDRLIPSVVPALNKTLRHYNLPGISELEELYVGDITMVVGIPETDPLPTAHPYHYIGPLLWQHPEAITPPWLFQISKPFFWLYPGNPSYGGNSKIFDSYPMLKACIEALAGENIHVILSMGHHSLPSSLKPIPANFQCVSYVPGLLIAQRSTVMIHHGGYGSCQTGLVTGTPSLILPTFSERESNARRIAALGAGEFVTPHSRKNKLFFDMNEIRTKALMLVNNPSYTANANRIGEKLNSSGGAMRAVNLIEDFLKHR